MGEVVGVVGLAYLVGVVFDRINDTVLGPDAQVIRLQVALDRMRGHRRNGDPFPQDAIEYELRREEKARIEWIDSLRSRMRTARELSVLGLPATLGAVTWMLHAYLDASRVGRYAVVLTALLLAYAVRRASRPSGERRTDEYFKTCERPVKTFLAATVGKEKSQAKKEVLRDARGWRKSRAWPFWLLLGVTFVGALLATAQVGREALPEAAMTIAGAALTGAARWAWGRITKTYLEFVAQA
jgi:hypothetical protein